MELTGSELIKSLPIGTYYQWGVFTFQVVEGGIVDVNSGETQAFGQGFWVETPDNITILDEKP